VFLNGRNLIVDGNVITAPSAGVELNNTRNTFDNVQITNNTINATGSRSGIMWQASDDLRNLTNLLIADNVIDAAGQYGIELYNDFVAGCSDWTITGNTITDATNAGILLNRDNTDDANVVPNCTVSGNTVTGCNGGLAAYNISGTIGPDNKFNANTGNTGGIDIFNCDALDIRDPGLPQRVQRQRG
jgi:hypothetical protein